jgi:hypothetical protein
MTKRFAPILLVSLLVATSGWSQPVTPPDTPAGSVLTAWLDAFNSGEKARLEAFDAKHDGRDPAYAENQLRFRSETGGFDLTEIRNSAPNYLEYMAKERASGREAIGMLAVSGDVPPRVVSSQMRLVMPGGTPVGFGIDAATRKRVISEVIAKLEENYVFPATAKKMDDSLRKAEKRGEYNQIFSGDELASRLTTQLQDVSRDKHLRVIFNPVAMPASPGAPGPRMTPDGCGFEKAERLPGNVGYVKLNQFGDPEICRDVAAAAMAFIASADAVIFDLRDNGGGHPDMVAFLTSYLFAERTHLNDFWTRRDNQTRESWTSEQVPGRKFTTQPVYVLTARRTFSGAEEFSYNLKHLKRATIVGEVTGGGAHPVRIQRIDDRFSIGVPDARPINAVTKTNWEGTGVEPDVQVPAADALTTAQKLAAEKIAAGRAAAVAKPKP